MAVIIQQVAGCKYGAHFYPCIAGVAQSHNYYPFSKMKAEEGIDRFFKTDKAEVKISGTVTILDVFIDLIISGQIWSIIISICRCHRKRRES